MGEDPSSGFSDPATWVNFGVLGVIFVGWVSGWLPSKSEVSRLEQDKARLIEERNRANVERDEAYAVIRDFNQIAAGLIEKIPTLSTTPVRRRRTEGDAR